MRRALGLDGAPSPNSKPPAPAHTSDGSAPRRRFVRDGEVPVTIVHGVHSQDDAGGANRLDATRQALQAQTAAREAAERSLVDAQAMIRDLQTKLAHERLARQEEAERAGARLRDAEQALEVARSDLAAEREQREQAESARDDAATALMKAQARAHKVIVDTPPAQASLPDIAAPDVAPPRRRGRPPKVRHDPPPSDSPYVEWWVPGWKDRYR